MAPTVRPADGDDVERIRDVAERSMTASYDLSPREIDSILAAEFSPEGLHEKRDSGDVHLLVAESDGELVGFVEGAADPDDVAVRWLHVHPAFRGRGAGTALFEGMLDTLAGEVPGGVDRVAVVADVEGGEFVERFGFGEADQREVEIGDSRVVEYVYTRGEDDAGSDASREPAVADVPETVATDGGETVYLGEEPLAGVEGSFVGTFEDESRETPVGYYCANCGSTDVSVDSMERLSCGECGNAHRPDDDYDGSYL